MPNVINSFLRCRSQRGPLIRWINRVLISGDQLKRTLCTALARLSIRPNGCENRLTEWYCLSIGCTDRQKSDINNCFVRNILYTFIHSNSSGIDHHRIFIYIIYRYIINKMYRRVKLVIKPVKQ